MANLSGRYRSGAYGAQAGLYGVGPDLPGEAFSGNDRRMDPGVAEMSINERTAELDGLDGRFQVRGHAGPDESVVGRVAADGQVGRWPSANWRAFC